MEFESQVSKIHTLPSMSISDFTNKNTEIQTSPNFIEQTTNKIIFTPTVSSTDFIEEKETLPDLESKPNTTTLETTISTTPLSLSNILFLVEMRLRNFFSDFISNEIDIRKNLTDYVNFKYNIFFFNFFLDKTSFYDKKFNRL